jgi:hypothetical protein
MAQTAFSYDPGLPSDRDWVRYYLGDTSPDRAEVDDRELDALLADEEEPEPAVDGDEPTPAQWRSYRKMVASRAAAAIAGKYAREADVSFENQRTSLSAKFAQFMKLSETLEADSQTEARRDMGGALKVVRW